MKICCEDKNGPPPGGCVAEYADSMRADFWGNGRFTYEFKPPNHGPGYWIFITSQASKSLLILTIKTGAFPSIISSLVKPYE